MSTPDRVIKAKLPARVIVGSSLIALFVLGFVIVAVWQSGVTITDARMRGTVIAKEFQPLSQPEREITLNQSGAMTARTNEGEMTITVEVPQRNGTTRTFTVWIRDRAQFDRIQVGDTFDVGPYVVPGE